MSNTNAQPTLDKIQEKKDLREALRRIRPSVSKESLAHFAEWERLNS